MNITPLINYINRIVHLTPEEELILTDKAVYRRYLKDQYIVQQGDVCKNVNFIVKGCTKAFHSTSDGVEHIVMFSIEDWWTSDIGSFTTQTPADYNVQCIENTELIQISYNNLQKLFVKIPKLERCFRIVTERAYASSLKRIVRNFSKTAKERYLIFKDSYPTLDSRIPQYMIASYLGITKEFLSKIKSQLAKIPKS